MMRICRYSILGLSCLYGLFQISLAASVASDEQSGKLIIPLAQGEVVGHQNVEYACLITAPKPSDDEKSLLTSLPMGGRFHVSYYSGDMMAIAAVPVDGRTVIFSNVVAGEGAKYTADRYIWWSHGDTVSFSRSDKDGPSVMCHVVTEDDKQKAIVEQSSKSEEKSKDELHSSPESHKNSLDNGSAKGNPQTKPASDMPQSGGTMSGEQKNDTNKISSH